jgi:3-polyprenyl-4-hydroxybenzoate decarboxylase
VSTKVRVGGIAKAVELRVFSTTRVLGHAKVVIVVEEHVDPFEMKQVMRVVSTKMNSAGDLVIVPHLSVLPLDPASQPDGITHKIVIDEKTPVPPDKRTISVRSSTAHSVRTAGAPSSTRPVQHRSSAVKYRD